MNPFHFPSKLIKKFAASAVGAACVCVAQGVGAQDTPWPEKPITLIAPFAAGGSTDMLARVIAQGLSKELGQNVIVDNKGGAGGTIGAAAAARAKPDGYTILLSNVTLGSAEAAYKNLSYDFLNDFNHVSYLGSIPCVVVASKRLPVKTVAEFMDYARKNQDTLTFGSSGVGAASHLCGQSFLSTTGLNATHVPYKGAGPMMIDVISGNLSFAIDTAGSAAAQVKAGKVRGIAVTSNERIALLDELPSLKESGIPFEMSIWYGLVTPKGTSAEINNKLYEATRRTLQHPSVQDSYKNLGATTQAKTQPQFKQLVAADKNRWIAIVKSAGITPN